MMNRGGIDGNSGLGGKKIGETEMPKLRKKQISQNILIINDFLLLQTRELINAHVQVKSHAREGEIDGSQ